jgi:anti-sigma regulatory factor (Ser/Thr protein kinase)
VSFLCVGQADGVDVLLIDEWQADLEVVHILDEGSLDVVEERVHRAARAGGARGEIAARSAAIATEIGRNILRHARGGRMGVELVRRDGAVGIEIIGIDRGAGLANVAGALSGSPDTGGAGGIGRIRRLSSELDLDVRVGEGTRIAARVFEESIEGQAGRRRRPEVGIHGRPMPGEAVSGDHAASWRTAEGLVVALCDGLGHGPLARAAASRAVATVGAHANAPLDTIFGEVHRALGSTRGGVLAVARIHERTRDVEFAIVGDVGVWLCSGAGTSQRFSGAPAVLGAPGGARKLRRETASFGDENVLVLASDGIHSSLQPNADPGLYLDSPAASAHRFVTAGARAHDDALVVVVR